MEVIKCTCKDCGATVSECANLWTQIGKTYFSPIVEPRDGFAIESHGPVRLGESGTLVEAWYALVFKRSPQTDKAPSVN